MVRDAIESILKQSYSSFEILVVDDGSTDGTFEILGQHFSGNPKLRIIRQENKERGAARNNGLLQSAGKYVQFLDSDDSLKDAHLEILANKIEELNSPDFICSKYELLRNGKSVPTDIQKIKEGYYDYTLFLKGNPLACNICVRKANEKLIPFEEDRSYSIKEDWMFLIQNLRYNKIYIIDEVSVRMNDHELRSMRSDNSIIIERTFKAERWISEKVSLSRSEKNSLKAHCNYFCSIHSYIDANRNTGLKYIFKAISLKGLKIKYMLLVLKLILGKNTVDGIKNRLS